jgi:hypothetical protein
MHTEIKEEKFSLHASRNEEIREWQYRFALS